MKWLWIVAWACIGAYLLVLIYAVVRFIIHYWPDLKGRHRR